MTEQDKSAIDIIYEMHEMLLDMSKRIASLEKSNMLLNDVILKQKIGVRDHGAAGKEMPIAPESPVVADPVAEPPTPAQIMSGNTQSNIKAFGYLKDSSGGAMHGITVSIVEANSNTLVKSTKTNRSGEFISFLKPGKYIAVATFEDNQQKFKAFAINKGMKDVEVSIL